MSLERHYLERELEDLLQKDATIWRFLREGSLDGVWYWDLENPQHEYMSPEFWRLFGFDPTTKTHDPAEWQDLIFPDDLDLAKENLARHIADPDHAYDQIVRYRCADGDTAWVRCRGIAVRDTDGKAIRLLGAHNDITQQMREERSAKMTSEFLAQIMDTAMGGIIALGHRGEILSINKPGRHFLGGVSLPTPFDWPEEMCFIDRETLQPIQDEQHPIRRAVDGGMLMGEILSMGRADGLDMRYVRISSAPVTVEGSSMAAVMILDDVSEQEKNRQQVERTARLDALGQLTGGIAHDFNNLLATVQYALELAESADSQSQRIGYLDIAKKSVERGSALTGRLLAFAKQQPGLAEAQRVTRVLEDFQRLAAPLIEATVKVDFKALDRDYTDSRTMAMVLESDGFACDLR
ncbi:MAG: PAS domain-containing protein, partial [Pseudomonadota bacterium]